MARGGGEVERGQSPDGDAQFNLNAYYLFSHIMLGQSRGQFLFSEGFLKANILDRCRPMLRAFPQSAEPPAEKPFRVFFGSEITLSPSGFRRIDPRFNFYVFATALNSICWITPQPEAGTIPSRAAAGSLRTSEPAE